jgi:hypothetical protein
VIHSSSIDRVRDATDIVSLVGEYIALKKSGVHHQGLCPFHKDKKTPSLSVDGNKGLWHCFGCQKGGNAFQWLQEIEGIPFPDALRRLADRAGISLDDERRRPAVERGGAKLDAKDVAYFWRSVKRRLKETLRELERWDRQACRKFGPGLMSGELIPADEEEWMWFCLQFPDLVRPSIESSLNLIENATQETLTKAYRSLPENVREQAGRRRREDEGNMTALTDLLKIWAEAGFPGPVHHEHAWWWRSRAHD